MAESDARKQKYLAARHPDTPIFTDVRHMGQQNAPTADGFASKVPEAGGASTKIKDSTVALSNKG